MPKIKTVHGIENRKVVSQKEWLAARKKLLDKEKKLSKLRDELNLQRRKLPWVKIEKEYVFDGPAGQVTLADLFCDKSQLLIYHFMFSRQQTGRSNKRGIGRGAISSEARAEIRRRCEIVSAVSRSQGWKPSAPSA
jgi:predicted dithiol-disulfide oxidoreductase (DUF899 family)